jgi:hypothetical protein
VTTPPQYQKILSYIDTAKGEGCNCVLGRGIATKEGRRWNLYQHRQQDANRSGGGLWACTLSHQVQTSFGASCSAGQVPITKSSSVYDECALHNVAVGRAASSRRLTRSARPAGLPWSRYAFTCWGTKGHGWHCGSAPASRCSIASFLRLMSGARGQRR